MGVLAEIDIRVGGTRPWDPQVHNDDLYGRVLAEGSLGLGEGYMDRWWDCEQLDEFLFRLIRNDLKQYVKLSWSMIALLLGEKLMNRQARGRRAEQVGRKHYDTGNDLFKAMLDKRMTYSCGYWEGAGNLDQAQENKLDLVCRKLGLESGMRVLDIGCGWVSIGMFEHVGPRNYRAIMQVVYNRMINDGLCLLHTIGAKKPNKKPNAWLDKYIFPGGILPTISQMGAAMEGLLMVEDWHNIAINYEKTLLAWHGNFEAA